MDCLVSLGSARETIVGSTLGRMLYTGLLIGMLAMISGCGGEPGGLVVYVDAEYDPAAASTASAPVSETASAAQIFEVLSDGRFERFWIAIANAESVDEGTIRITVRPLDGMGEPNPDPNTSIIDPIVVDVTTLPVFPAEAFAMFDVGDEPGRNVLTGERYAIVLDFLSRVVTGGASDGLPIARFLGRDDDGYVDGSGSESTDAGATWTNSATDDFIFRTFVIR